MIHILSVILFFCFEQKKTFTPPPPSKPTTTSGVPELNQAHGADVQPVQENLTLVQLHHTEQGQEQGGLAGACASHDAHLLPRSHYQAHSVQSVRKTVPVGQNHSAELQPALLRPRRCQLMLRQKGQSEKSDGTMLLQCFNALF